MNTLNENQSETEVQPTTRRPRRLAPILVVGGAFALAVLMWAINFQPVSSDTGRLVAVYAPGTNLLDPNADVWKEDKTWATKGNKPIATTIVPVSAQLYLKQGESTKINQMTARAAHDGKDLAVLVRWQDNSQNVTSDLSKEAATYSDAVAVEFPMDITPGRTAFRCMGQTDARVNIWQWKAERDASQTNALGVKPVQVSGIGSAAKNYIGPGGGYLVDPAKDDPQTYSSYDPATKTWTVIFRRSLTTSNPQTGAQLVGAKAGAAYNSQVAFAVWDGGNGERLSKKAVSTWVDLSLDEGDTSPQNTQNLFNLGLFGVATIVVIFLAWRLLPSTSRVNRE